MTKSRRKGFDDVKRGGGYGAGNIVRRGRISEARSSGCKLEIGLARAWLEAPAKARGDVVTARAT